MSEDTRAKVLAAAGPIFAEKGFEKATVREICQAADVNLASVNYYFGDKETLYIETVRAARELKVSQVPMPRFVPEIPADARLQAFVRTLLTRMLSADASPWQSRLIQREILNPTQACEKMVRESFRPEHDLLISIIAELVPSETPSHRIHQFAFSVIGQCLFYRVADCIIGLLLDPQERQAQYTIEALTEHVTQLTLGGIRAYCEQKPHGTSTTAAAQI